jgi:hypothetical protein
MIKEHLSIEERLALSHLVELCKRVNLLVEDEGNSDWLITNGEPLNLESIEKKDWDLCINALED